MVYKAKCHVLNRYVAVKILRDEFTTDEEFIKRFNTEAQAVASLTHPNMVSVYDVGSEDNIHYIVMELIKGKTLKEIINLETGETEIVTVQKHHPELRTKTVVELVIAPNGYYVCFKDNYTSGEINPYFEEEKEKTEAEKMAKLSLTKREAFCIHYRSQQVQPCFTVF